MNKNQRIQGPAEPLEKFDAERENNLSYMSFLSKTLFKVLMTVSILLAFSICLNLYLFFTHKDIRFIALTPDMRVIDVAPLNEPLISDAGLLSWYMQTISDTFSFTYNDWKDRLSAMQYRYSPEAFQAIVNGFYKYVEKISEDRQIMNTVFLRMPRIIQKGQVRQSEPYTWTIEGIAEISIEGGRSQQSQRVLIKVVVERVHPSQVPSGILIKSVVFKPV